MPIHKVVIPVAGLGTRLLPATKSQPKEMLPVGRKPVVQYVVEEMAAQGVNQVLFITGRNKRSIEDHFDFDPEMVRRLAEREHADPLAGMDHQRDGVDFFYTRQSVPAGIADAVRLAQGFVGDEPFVVALGDAIIRSEGPPTLIRRMIGSHLAHGSGCTVAVWEVEPSEVRRYGVVRPVGEAGGDFAIDDIVEKPAPERAPSCIAVAARYVFSPAIFEAIARTPPGLGGELQITDAIRVLMEMGHSVRGVHLRADERRYDIGNPETYFKAFIDFALSDPQYGATIRRYLREQM